MNISEVISDVSEKISSTAGSGTVIDVLNGFLDHFLGDAFTASSGRVTDQAGESSEFFSSVIYTPIEGAGEDNPESIPADNVAAVIDVCPNLDLQSFRAAYSRIAQAKTLKKTPAEATNNVPRTNITLGVIFALRSGLTMEEMAEELERLNLQTPSAQWPDMIVLASTGVINYTVQFPGGQPSGDFLPPAENALKNYTPSIYIVTTLRPTGSFTLNKLLSYLTGHLAIFSPGAALPDWKEIGDNIPPKGITLSGYQYNLNGDLLPVPREYYNDRLLPSLPVRIEDQQGKLLAAIQFLPWQDGGVILLKGDKLPLDGLLVFLGREALKRSGVIRQDNDLQISYVLPITQTDFGAMLTRLQRQSNMVVKNDPGKMVFQKIADEGTGTPFMARLMLGIMRLRDLVFQDVAGRDKFDNAYEVVLSSLNNVRTSAQEISRLWSEHAEKINTGVIVRQQGQAIHIEESIDRELKRDVESFLNASTRALKLGMQNLAKELGVEIGFLFKQQGAFDTGIAALEKTNPALADYLRQTRTWSEPMIKCRIDLEHGSWTLPRIEYLPSDNGMQAVEPQISGKPVTEFVDDTFNRLVCFVEEFTAHCLQQQMSAGMTLTEIAPTDRSAEESDRFRVTMTAGGLPAWMLTAHNSPFEGV